MKVSQKGLYALQAMMMLTRRHTQGAIRIRDIAYEPEEEIGVQCAADVGARRGQ